MRPKPRPQPKPEPVPEESDIQGLDGDGRESPGEQQIQDETKNAGGRNSDDGNIDQLQNVSKLAFVEPDDPLDGLYNRLIIALTILALILILLMICYICKRLHWFYKSPEDKDNANAQAAVRRQPLEMDQPQNQPPPIPPVVVVHEQANRFQTHQPRPNNALDHLPDPYYDNNQANNASQRVLMPPPAPPANYNTNTALVSNNQNSLIGSSGQRP